jgi:RES domain-containing protein
LARVIASAEYAWGAEDQIVSRMYGDQWLIGKRSAVLLVPSVVTQGRERNVLINPEHPDFAQMTAAEPQDVHWDRRLFQR